MIVDVDLDRDTLWQELPAATLAVLARATRLAAGRDRPAEALRDLAEAVRTTAGADLVLVRAAGDPDAGLETIAGAGPAPLVAELLGGRLPLEELPSESLDALDVAPEAVRHAARRSAAQSLLLVPVPEDGGATLELLRAGARFSPQERRVAELVAGEVSLVLRTAAGREADEARPASRPPLEVAGDALTAALDDEQAPGEIARLAAELNGAPVAILWEQARDGTLRASGMHGVAADADVEPARLLAEEAFAAARPASTAPAERLPAGCVSSTTVPLGRPPVGALQLLHASSALPEPEQLERLTTFAVRASAALRAASRTRLRELELERTRAVLTIVGQATADLSLAHTLETAVDRIAEIFGVDRVAVYLRSAADGTLVLAAGRGVGRGQASLAERLLELALAARGQSVVEVGDASGDERSRGAADVGRDGGARGFIAAPLLAQGEAIGLIAVHPEGRRHRDDDTALLAALAGQLAVAVQNARLHEQATQLGEEREAALRSERSAARRLRVLYEVSRSFAQSLSLDETLEALARTAVDVLDLDGAAIQMPDERREHLLARAVHVRDSQLGAPLHALLARPAPFAAQPVQRVFRDAHPVLLDASTRARDETIARALGPFLGKGWTAALVPVATPGEVIASLAILSCRPGAPVTEETIEAAVAVGDQAALAIDNARLYQQQKRFADTMQRSLLPWARPSAPGLETGRVYESSARLDVGGDLYDFLVLADGRLAAVLGDVTGHGIDATADMAMAKYVFRSLAREHPEPGDLLAAANDVVVGEIAPGTFITMTYLVVDGIRGEVACASAGHPAPRLVLPEGTTSDLGAPGLALGIDAGQTYEETRAPLAPGAVLVLYTDGVVESRRDGELYGVERLDALLAERRDLSAQALARAVAEDARAFSGGELSDDLAVVVIRRTP